MVFVLLNSADIVSGLDPDQKSQHDQEISQSHCRPMHGSNGTVRNSHRTLTVTRHQEDGLSESTSSPHQDCKTMKDTKYRITTEPPTNNGSNNKQLLNTN